MGDVISLATLRPEPWLTKRQLAEHLGVSESWISRRMASIPHQRLGKSPQARLRFKASEVDHWLKEAPSGNRAS